MTLRQDLGIDFKTVDKWRKRATIEGLKTAPKAPYAPTLSSAERGIVVAFRRDI